MLPNKKVKYSLRSVDDVEDVEEEETGIAGTDFDNEVAFICVDVRGD
jgi:hypothetical protein